MESRQIEAEPLGECELDMISGGRVCNHAPPDGSEHHVRPRNAGDLGDLHLLRLVLVREVRLEVTLGRLNWRRLLAGYPLRDGDRAPAALALFTRGSLAA
jgi:hypothetical protein